MSNLSRKFLSLISFSAASLVAAATSPSLAHAENGIEIVPATAGGGIEVSAVRCPCFNWVVRTKALSGKIETNSILISSEALFKFQQMNNVNFQQISSQLFTIGDAQILLKEQHIGIGFKGVTFGADNIDGYSNLLRTGLYAMISLVQKAGIGFTVNSGYDFEKMKTQMGIEAERHILEQSAVLNWDSGPWSGGVNARFGFSPDHLDTQHLRVSTGAGVRGRIFSFSDLELGLGAEIKVEHDPFRELLGLNPTDATAMVLMDLSWVAARTH